MKIYPKISTQKLVTSLLIGALIFSIISCFTYFVYIETTVLGEESVHQLIWFFPKGISIVTILLTILSPLLFLLYVIKFHKNCEMTILIPLIFIILAIKSIWIWLFEFHYGVWGILFGDTGGIIIESTFFFLIAFSTLNGLSNKFFFSSLIIIGLISIILNVLLFQWDSLTETETIFYICLSSDYISQFSLYLASLLFGISNRIPQLLKRYPSPKSSPEKALEKLKERYDLGMLTEDEYKAERHKILNKL